MESNLFVVDAHRCVVQLPARRFHHRLAYRQVLRQYRHTHQVWSESQASLHRPPFGRLGAACPARDSRRRCKHPRGGGPLEASTASVPMSLEAHSAATILAYGPLNSMLAIPGHSVRVTALNGVEVDPVRRFELNLRHSLSHLRQVFCYRLTGVWGWRGVGGAGYVSEQGPQRPVRESGVLA